MAIYHLEYAQMTPEEKKMVIRTRIFSLCNGKYRNLSELAQAMGLSLSQVSRVREGKRSINQKFIIGAKKAFPQYNLDDLFYFDSGESRSPQNEPEVTVTPHHSTIQRPQDRSLNQG